MNKTNWFDVLVLVMVVLTVLVAPTQWALKIKMGAEHTVADVGLSPADLMLALTALVWGIGVLVRAQLRRLRWPPLAAWVFVLLCVPSVFWGPSMRRGAAELVQYVEYFLVAYLVFVNTIVTRRAKIAVLAALFVGLGVNTLLAWRMYTTVLYSDALLADVAGLLGNRNIFGVYLCLLVPLAGALALLAAKVYTKAVGVLLVVLSVGIILAGGPFLGLLVGLGVLVAMWRFRYLPVYFALVLLVVLVGLPVLRYNNRQLLTESVFMYNEQGSSEEYRVAKRYLEWQAALKSLDPSQPPYFSRADYFQKTLLGHGIGLYEKEVERFMGTMPRAPQAALEQDTQNQYLVLAVSCGFPAALAFMWLLASYAHRARMSLLTSPDRLDKAITCGFIAGIVAIAVAGNFAPVIVRGVGLVLVCLAAMATGRKVTAR